MRETVLEHMIKCTGCAACLVGCPKGAISMKRDAEGFLYPDIDVNACIDCGLCEKNCPTQKKENPVIARALAARSRDEGERMASSSGGVFSLLARNVLSQGGVVFGAAFDEELKLAHIGIMSEREIGPLRGSKYLQSDASEACRYAVALAKMGTQVLFCGTPCQVAGVRAALGNTYENVLLVDIVCHGAPSPAVFDSYIKGLEQEHGKRATHYTFRDKRKGWKDFSVVAGFEDGTEYTGTQTVDPFMRGFLHNLYLRPSCTPCHYEGFNRQGDITLADLWGAQLHLKEWDDDKGLSMVFVNTSVGNIAMRAIAKDVQTRTVDHKKFMRFNPSIEKSAIAHSRRGRFFKSFAKQGFDKKVIDKLLAPPGQFERGVKKIGRIPSALKRRLGLTRAEG